MDLRGCEPGSRSEDRGPLQRGPKIAASVGSIGFQHSGAQFAQGPGDGRCPRLSGADQPDPVLLARTFDAPERHGLENVQDSSAASDQSRAHRVVDDQDRGGRVMNTAAPAKERASARSHQEENGSDAEKEEKELAKADGAGVLFFCAEEIPECWEHHPLGVMPMEEM